MTIRKQLALGFAVILLLSVANLAVNFWADFQRSESLDSLRRATERQVLLVHIARELDDLYKQNQLYGQMVSSAELSTLPPDQIEELDRRFGALRLQFSDLHDLTDEAEMGPLSVLEEAFDGLVKSWRRFYLYFGRNHEEALTEIILNAEPLSQQVMVTLLPNLELAEGAMMQDARDALDEVSKLTDTLSLSIFLGSTGLLLVMVVLFSHRLNVRLQILREGAERLGEGDIGYQIDETRSDELAGLAHAFNNMALKQQASHRQLTVSKEKLQEQYHEVDEQRERGEELLLNILPPATAEELTSQGEVSPRYYEDATVMFGDISGFTLSSEKMAADELVAVLHRYFTAFDHIVGRYQLEKLKTIGDCYMCVGGVPERRPSHAVDMVLACLELANKVEELRTQGPDWRLRIGLHSGPVIAGVVGIKKFAFDIWGNTVNLAARLESSGEPGEVNVSEQTYIQIKDFFEVEERGAVMTKDRRYVPMYFVRNVLEGLVDTDDPIPASFAKRYEVYFQQKPTAFPEFLTRSAGDRKAAS